MKQRTIIFVALLSLMLPGCTDLDEKWYSEVTPDTYFTTKETVYSFLVRSFTHWRWFQGWERNLMQETVTDEMCLTKKGIHFDAPEYEQLHHHRWNTENWVNDETWRGVGMGISLTLACKETLAKMDYTALGMTEEEKTDHQMQLQSLIAYYYERGLDFYGGMPIYRNLTDKEQKRSTAKETYAYIEELLLDAIPRLHTRHAGMLEEGYVSRGTAAALLARLYFNAEAYIGENHFAECAAVCQDILDGKYGFYALEENWWGPFTFDNDHSPEIMWSAQSNNNKYEINWQYGYNYHYNMIHYFDLSGYESWNGFHLQPSLKPNGEPYDFKLGRPFAKFNDKDLRKKKYVYLGDGKYEGMFLYGEMKRVSRTGEVLECRGQYEYAGELLTFVDQVAQFRKFLDGEVASKNDLPSTILTGEENSGVRLVKMPVPDDKDRSLAFNSDYPVIRYAEIYYMLGECRYRAGDKAGAAALFNAVRARNFENRHDPDPVTAGNIDKWRILDEWMIEFLGEQRRRTDLRRWGQFTEGEWWDHKPSKDDKYQLFPVPQKAISISNVLQQNPGYGGNEMTEEDAGIFKVAAID